MKFSFERHLPLWGGLSIGGEVAVRDSSYIHTKAIATAPSDPRAIPIFICEIEQLGGAERSLLALSRWLTEQGRPNYILTYRDHCNLAQYASHPLQVIDLNVQSGVRNKLAALRNHLGDRPMAAPKPICSGYQPALHSTLIGLRGFHCLMHDTPSLFEYEVQRTPMENLRLAVSSKIIAYGLKSGGKTIVTSEFLQSDCRNLFGIETKIERMGGISRNPPVATVHPAPRGPNDRMTFLSVCRVEENKRIDWIIRALAELERAPFAPLQVPLSRLVNWRFEVVGHGSGISKLRSLAESLGVLDRIHFHGFVSDEVLEQMYAKADLFLMPAIQGYGIPAIEALGHGSPVLLHRESGVSDILLETPWATVVHGDANEMTHRVAEAVDGVLRGKHHAIAPPRLPTEEQWAKRVCAACGWVR